MSVCHHDQFQGYMLAKRGADGSYQEGESDGVESDGEPAYESILRTNRSLANPTGIFSNAPLVQDCSICSVFERNLYV